MKKYLLLILVVAICFCILISCDKTAEEQATEVDESVEMTIYKAAQELGFEGTLEEFLLLVKGADGVGISNIVCTENNELIVTLTNGRVITLSTIVPKNGVDGKDGEDGRDGVDITNVEIINGSLFVTLSTGRQINCGSIVDAQGGAGRGIASLHIDSAGNLIVIYSDSDNEYNLGKVKGEKGSDGVAPTISVNDAGYWVINGEVTSVKARGEDGKNGANGTNGTNGTNGAKGDNGLSAYELYKKYHNDYDGDEEQWVEDLVAGRLAATVYHDVTIIINGNETVQKVAHNDTIDFTDIDIDRDGYSFDGWEYESGGEFLIDTPITSDSIVIVAAYHESEIEEYTEQNELSQATTTLAAMTRKRITLDESIQSLSGVRLSANAGTIIYKLFKQGEPEPLESHDEANGRYYNIDFTETYQYQGGVYILDVTFRCDDQNEELTITALA